MLKQICAIVPSGVLNAVYDAIFPELVRRGDIQFLDSDNEECVSVYCDGCEIKLFSKRDDTYTVTWSVFKDGNLIKENSDDWFEFLGEAEANAMQWIQENQAHAL